MESRYCNKCLIKTDHKIIDAEYKGLSHGFEEINFNEDYILDDIDIKNKELINLEKSSFYRLAHHLLVNS